MQNFPYLEQKNGGWVWNFPKSLNMATQVCDFWEIKSPEKICIKDFTDVDLPVLYSYKDLRKFSGLIEPDIHKVLDPVTSVKSRNGVGETAPKSVKRESTAIIKRLKKFGFK